MALWTIRLAFMALCALTGFAVSEVHPDLVKETWAGVLVGFGFGGLLIAIDEMLKGFSLRAFSASTFGLMLGMLVAWIIDSSGLFDYTDRDVRWLIRLSMFTGFSYIGIILAMRSNKEDFYLIIPFVRFTPQQKSESLYLLDTSAIIDGRIVPLLSKRVFEGIMVVPRFVLRELQTVADSRDDAKRARGRRGLEMLAELQNSHAAEVKIHEGDITEERSVDLKLIQLAKMLGAKLVTTDYNLTRIAELQTISCVNLHELATCLKPVVLPGETFNLRIIREGKDKNQGVAYLHDGTMVVVNEAAPMIGKEVDVQIINMLQTGAGVIVFADLSRDAA